MGCTVDHLSADHRVEIIQDFHDARGMLHRTGETGILRRLELDWPKQEIQIEWERDGGREVMFFSLATRQGPRNGAMREFFAIGEYLPTPKHHAPNTPAPLASEPATYERPTPAACTRPYAPGRQPAGEVCLGERAVACDCDPALHRAVLIEPRNIHVTACLACGTVTCTKLVGDDGRFHGNPAHAYWTVPVPQTVVDWLALWPRVRVTYDSPRWPMSSLLVRREYLYYPADTHCDNPVDLARLETRLLAEQSTKPAARRLRDLPTPSAPAPAEIPELLSDFVDVWNALLSTPDADLSTLIYFAQPSSRASHIGVDLLWRRPDTLQIMEKALRSDDEVWQTAGFALAREARASEPNNDLPVIVINLLNNLLLEPLEDVPGRIASCQQFEALLILIAEHKLATPKILSTLANLQRSLLCKDKHLGEYISLVLAELNSIEAPEVR